MHAVAKLTGATRASPLSRPWTRERLRSRTLVVHAGGHRALSAVMVEPGGRPPVHSRRETVNALAYWLRAGCAWRLLPHDQPAWQTVYYYWRVWRVWRVWRTEGRWERVRTTDRGGLHGYDGAKRAVGRRERRRHQATQRGRVGRACDAGRLSTCAGTPRNASRRADAGRQVLPVRHTRLRGPAPITMRQRDAWATPSAHLFSQAETLCG
ncbi:transposase [Actinomadura fibrosa]|uniref:Transposase n=2 Tax=Actinomadura fibrosa TaxID=111802 RepID=A0ABW2Y314_9ACTN